MGGCSAVVDARSSLDSSGACFFKKEGSCSNRVGATVVIPAKAGIQTGSTPATNVDPQGNPATPCLSTLAILSIGMLRYEQRWTPASVATWTAPPRCLSTLALQNTDDRIKRIQNKARTCHSGVGAPESSPRRG